MLLLRALLLWSIVSLHIVGGAAIFRRLFPRESPWFGFIVPALALVVALNFVEHIVALPSLLWLLPITTLTSIWAVMDHNVNWKGLRLPTGIFLACFTVTLGVRCLRPDILSGRDGGMDLCLAAAYLMGEKVPPHLLWFPPLVESHYYSLELYGLSVMTRLFCRDIGTGFNLATALMHAWLCFLPAAIAWRIGRQKMWITILAPIMILCLATGASVYLWWAIPEFDPAVGSILLNTMENPDIHLTLWKFLHQTPEYTHAELDPPGVWIGLGSFHSATGGQFLVLLLGLALAEALRRKRTNWPWVALGAIPLLTVLTSSWALILEGPLLLGAIFLCWWYRFFPRNPRFVITMLAVITALVAAPLLDALTNYADIGKGWTDPEARTQLAELLAMWWPVFLPAIALVFVWRKVSPVVQLILVGLPLVFLIIEFYTVGPRTDWTGKLWGFTYGLAWVTLFPALCRRRAIAFRYLTVFLVAYHLVAAAVWPEYWWKRGWDPRDVMHLEGDGAFRNVPMRGKIMLALSQMKGQTVLTGRACYRYCESPSLAAFTGNRLYVSWFTFDDDVEGGLTYRGAHDRAMEVDTLYDGTNPNPLLYLRQHDIAAMAIFPDDNIKSDVIARLQAQLSPYYSYDDFSENDTHAGIFVFRPQTLGWPPGLLTTPAASPSKAAGSPQ